MTAHRSHPRIAETTSQPNSKSRQPVPVPALQRQFSRSRLTGHTAENILALQRSLGNRYVGRMLQNQTLQNQKLQTSAGSLQRAPVKTDKRAGPVKPAKATDLERALLAGKDATETMELVRATLFPAYRRAVDAMDTFAALELAQHVVGSIRIAEQGAREVLRASPDSDYHRFLVSTPGHPEESESAVISKFLQLTSYKTELVTNLPALEADWAIRIGPQTFRDQPVLGRYTSPAMDKDPAGYLASEAGVVVELLALVQQIRDVAGATGGTCPLLTAEQTEQIIGLVEPWKSRPVNFAFLVRVLNEESIWQAVSNVKGKSGKTLEQTNTAVATQARVTGALADVGELNTETLRVLFGMNPTQTDLIHALPISDSTAMKVFEKLQDAAPEARGPLIRQIEGMEMLSEFCKHLPWKYVEALHDAIVPSDPHAAGLLVPYYQGKGGGESLHQLEMDKVDERLRDDRTISAFGWFFLDFASNAFTAGFHHEYSEAYDLNQQGWTTDHQFRSAATKALGKAALITAVSAMTGGVAGKFGQGLGAGLRAGESGAEIIGGAAGGIGASLGGHFTGDVYDQLLNGKKGFDSFGSYAKSAAAGGAMGTVLAGISVGAGSFLGSSMRPIDAFAARYPNMSKVLESIRGSGFRSGTAVRMKVSDLADLVNSGFGGPGGPNAFAYAAGRGPDIRRLPPDTEIEVGLRPVRQFTQPMQMSNANGGNNGGGSDGPGGKTAHADPAAAQKQNARGPYVEIEKVTVVEADSAARSSALQDANSETDSLPVPGKNVSKISPDDKIVVADAGKNKCVGNVCADILNAEMGVGPEEGYTTSDLEREFNINFGRTPSGKSNPDVATPQAALRTIARTTGFAAVNKTPINFGTAKAEGQYAVFFGDNHVIRAEISGGEKIIISDPSLAKTWNSWQEFLEFAETNPSLYGTRPGETNHAYLLSKKVK